MELAGHGLQMEVLEVATSVDNQVHGNGRCKGVLHVVACCALIGVGINEIRKQLKHPESYANQEAND